MSCMSLIIQNAQLMVLWFSNLAQINVGAITVIWSVTPLFIAIIDYLLFQVKLKYNYIIGIILMLASAIVLSLYSMIFKPVSNGGFKVLDSWIPVVCSAAVPVFFTMRYFLFRKATDKKYGSNYNTSDLLASTFFVLNIPLTIIAVVYWSRNHFD